jgi:hypothetical protein
VLLVLCGALVAACVDKTLPGEPLVADLAALPDELAEGIRQADIEGVVTYLHDRREAGDPQAYALTVATYYAAQDNDLRQNMVYVFAHFNTLEADQQLIRIAETDADAATRQYALRAIGYRTPRQWDERSGLNWTREPLADLYTYPEMSEAQIGAVRPALRRIALDNDNPAQMSAMYAMGKNGDESAFLDELLRICDDPLVMADAVVLLARPEDQGRLLRELYERWKGEADSRGVILSRLQSSHPSLDGVEAALAAARDGMEQDFDRQYVYISDYFERFLPSERALVIDRLEQEMTTFEPGSQPAQALQEAINRLKNP